jgi:hypothetical protein
MKFKTTKKYINSIYNPVYSVGYCGAYYLLYGLEPFAYHCGVYGWNCDYYYSNSVVICTGYRPHGLSTIGKTADFEKQARKVVENNQLSYCEKCYQVSVIRTAWISELLNI